MTEAHAISKLAPGLAAKEVWTHRAEWDFAKFATGLGRRPVLLITSDDGLAPTAASLAAAHKAGGNQQMTERDFAADHSCSDKRIGLQVAVFTWLATFQ